MTEEKERQNFKSTNNKTIILMNNKDFYSARNSVNKVTR